MCLEWWHKQALGNNSTKHLLTEGRRGHLSHSADVQNSVAVLCQKWMYQECLHRVRLCSRNSFLHQLSNFLWARGRVRSSITNFAKQLAIWVASLLCLALPETAEYWFSFTAVVRVRLCPEWELRKVLMCVLNYTIQERQVWRRHLPCRLSESKHKQQQRVSEDLKCCEYIYFSALWGCHCQLSCTEGKKKAHVCTYGAAVFRSKSVFLHLDKSSYVTTAEMARCTRQQMPSDDNEM